MNCEQLLYQLVGEAHRLLGGGSMKMHICIFEGTLNARLRKHTDKPHDIIYKFTPGFFTEGLSPKDWDNLAIKCWYAKKGLQKCRKQSELLTLPKPTNSSHNSSKPKGQ